MNKRFSFYKATINTWIKDKNAKILVVAGGAKDCEIFMELGCKNVTISNVDTRAEDAFSPFLYSFQNAENLTFEDNSFDFVVIHAALHHCYSPHRALLNMYRVAKKGVIFFESRDSFMMKIVTHFGLTQTYEHAAVFHNGGKSDGVENTDIPNFVYRWTEREIEKTINCYAPFSPHNFSYKYDCSIPPSTIKTRIYKTILVTFSKWIYLLLIKLFPKQQNLFACYIQKPNLKTELFEWLEHKNGKIVFNQKWGENYYKNT